MKVTPTLDASILHARKRAFIIGLVLAVLGVRCIGEVHLVSERDLTVQVPTTGNGNSVLSWFSPDARFVLFNSSANNIAPGDNDSFWLNVFLRDRLSSTTVLVSVNHPDTGGGDGDSFELMASTNGRYVLFLSYGSNLVPGDTNGASDVLFVIWRLAAHCL